MYVACPCPTVSVTDHRKPPAADRRLAVNTIAGLLDELDRAPDARDIAFPSTDEQIEVYDPSPAVALRTAESGIVRPAP
jgi:hypothetical protein